MIAADTSSLIAYLSGATGDDVALLEEALVSRQVVLPPVVLSELLSDPKAGRAIEPTLRELPKLSIAEGYWHRAGSLRASLLARGFKARLADALIAQSCLDHRVPLIARDADFRNFARHGGLRLLPHA